MFGLGRSRKDPLADARSAERWLVTGLPSDPLNMHEELRALLGTLSGPAARLTPKSLAALFVIDTHAQQLFRALTAQYVGHAGRSAKIERQI